MKSSSEDEDVYGELMDEAAHFDTYDAEVGARMEQHAARSGVSMIDVWEFLPWSRMLQEQLLKGVK